jgi:hypothetical protein
MSDTRIHRHRPSNASTEHGWSDCVTDRSDCGAAHGGMVYRDVCDCGAVRHTESNGGHTARTEWIAPKDRGHDGR